MTSPALTAPLAPCRVSVKFHGKASHASAYPWEGVNALDAAVLAYNNLSALRQQLKPDWRLHGGYQFWSISSSCLCKSHDLSGQSEPSWRTSLTVYFKRLKDQKLKIYDEKICCKKKFGLMGFFFFAAVPWMTTRQNGRTAILAVLITHPGFIPNVFCALRLFFLFTPTLICCLVSPQEDDFTADYIYYT